MELFDEDTFNTDLIDAGTKKVKKKMDFFRVWKTLFQTVL